SIQSPMRTLDLLSPKEYKEVMNDIIDAGGGNQEDKVTKISNDGKGTNWQKEVTRTALMQNYQVNMSGGSEKTQYYLSLNHINQEGIARGSNFKRFGFRFNLNSQISEKFKIGFNSTASYLKNNYIPNGFIDNEQAGVFYTAVNFDPTLAVR